MNEPKRLLESGSPRVRALVDAGKHDAPNGSTERAVLGALGLGAASGALLGAGSSVARSALARSLAVLRHAALSKLGVGVIAVASAGSAGYFAGRAHERAISSEAGTASTAPSTSGLPPRPKLAAQSPAPAALSSVPTSSSSIAPMPSSPSLPSPRPLEDTPAHAAREPQAGMAKVAAADARPRGPGVVAQVTADAPAAPPEPARRDPAIPIALQLESIRTARALVAKGDGNAALSELDSYEAKSPQGTFEEEAMALRVRALRLTGDTAGAARELARLGSRFPGSVHLAALAR
jgi:hypothetical protein